MTLSVSPSFITQAITSRSTRELATTLLRTTAELMLQSRAARAMITFITQEQILLSARATETILFATTATIQLSTRARAMILFPTAAPTFQSARALATTLSTAGDSMLQSTAAKVMIAFTTRRRAWSTYTAQATATITSAAWEFWRRSLSTAQISRRKRAAQIFSSTSAVTQSQSREPPP